MPYVENARKIMQQLWDRVEKADSSCLTEEEFLAHLCLCAKGSAGGEWSTRGFTNLEDIFGEDPADIAPKCKVAYAAMDAIKKEGKVTFDDAFQCLLNSITERIPNGDLAYLDVEFPEDGEGWTNHGDSEVQSLRRVAEKFEGKKPETASERLEWFKALGHKVFDMVDVDKDGFLEKSEVRQGAMDAMLLMMPKSMRASMAEEMSEECDNMVETCYGCADANLDGKLSFEEAYLGFLASGFIEEFEGEPPQGQVALESATMKALEAMEMGSWLDLESRMLDMTRGLLKESPVP